MNKAEFKEGQEVWAKVVVVAPSVDVNGEIQLSDGEYGLVWVKPEEIMTAMPEKPVIPQAAADWLEEAKNKNMLLSEALDLSGTPVSFDDWLSKDERKNQETFARAWLDGYEVEKEQMYTVVIPNPNIDKNHITLLQRSEDDKLELWTFAQPDLSRSIFHFTEDEIKEDFEWAWQWAKPVEE
ncbi:hypothetical protein SAG0136_08000 [Streptococcus agalactiae LMG 14747]|uniref:DUF1642 domain-containing protein n=1 Tax=Streptococcus agalactiae LMG 14747 TaxID=1154860 RepID=V6Z344_STRAG|nr:hypothetical protein SAG0136_08000 [Streptococcus agalactiae LMG 14747]